MRFVVGCPVQDRAWCLPRWLDAIEDQKMDLDVLCLLSKSSDDTEAVLRRRGVRYIRDPYPGRTTSAIHRHQWAQPEDHAYIAELRNALLEIVIEQRADFFFSLDSDIVLPHGAIDRLIAVLDRGVIAPYVNMALKGSMHNTMAWDDRAHPGTAHHRENMQRGYVDVVMGAILMDRRGMEARWRPHPQGADVGFCLDADEKSIPRWWEPSVRCEHLLEGPAPQITVG
jgi:hypothetical protein